MHSLWVYSTTSISGYRVTSQKLIRPSLSDRTHLGVAKRRLVHRIRLIRKQIIRRIVYGHRYTSKTRKSEGQ